MKWLYQNGNNQKHEAENAEQTGIVRLPKWVYVYNVINLNYHIEHAQTVGTIKDVQSSQFKQVKPTHL